MVLISLSMLILLIPVKQKPKADYRDLEKVSYTFADFKGGTTWSQFSKKFLKILYSCYSRKKRFQKKIWQNFFANWI